MIVDILKRLTSNYRKDESSNTYKIIKLFTDELEEVKSSLQTIELWRDIEQAEGSTLDKIGVNVTELRNNRGDVEYRQALLVAIASNTSGGDIERINEILTVLLGDNFLGVREVWSDPTYNFEPAAIAIRFQNLEQLIEKEYEELENDPWFLDGLFLLNGERLLDGGTTFQFTDFEQQIADAIQATKDIVEFIKAGGIKVYWEEPIEIKNAISIINEVKTTINQLVQNTIEIQHNVSTNINQSVVNSSKWYLDGMYNLDGTVLLDGSRPIIAHSVEVLEVIA